MTIGNNQYRFVVGRRDELPRQVFERLLVYRHAVFVERLGWALPQCGAGWELDEFDTESALYVVCCSESTREIHGCGRLLPTLRPYLLERHFPQVIAGSGPPRSRFVWELSRYAAGAPGAQRGLPKQVFQQCLQTAADSGAHRVVGVLSLALERICRRIAPVQRLGPPQRHESGLIVGCAVDVRPGAGGGARAGALLDLGPRF